MGQGKPDIKGGVAPMNYLMVEQHELIGTDQNVLRAVIPVNQSQTVQRRLRYQVAEKLGHCQVAGRGVVVVRFDAQRLKKSPAMKNPRQFILLFGRRVLDGSKQIGKLLHSSELQLT